MNAAHAFTAKGSDRPSACADCGKTWAAAAHKAHRAAAKARQAKIDAMLAAAAEGLVNRGWEGLTGYSGRLSYRGIAYGDLAATAAYAVDNGMTYRDVCMTQA
jgi:hypothetical protein